MIPSLCWHEMPLTSRLGTPRRQWRGSFRKTAPSPLGGERGSQTPSPFPLLPHLKADSSLHCFSRSAILILRTGDSLHLSVVIFEKWTTRVRLLVKWHASPNRWALNGIKMPEKSAEGYMTAPWLTPGAQDQCLVQDKDRNLTSLLTTRSGYQQRTILKWEGNSLLTNESIFNLYIKTMVRYDFKGRVCIYFTISVRLIHKSLYTVLMVCEMCSNDFLVF